MGDDCGSKKLAITEKGIGIFGEIFRAQKNCWI